MLALNILLYYGFLLPLSFLPFPVLYVISDFLFFLFYQVFKYRKTVVLVNLRNSFPDKSEAERVAICKNFYRHFTDLVVESIKMFSISEKQVLKRFSCVDPELMNAYYDQKKSVFIAGGHYNNWEFFAVAIARLIKHKPVGIYKPLSNLYFDRKMRESRGKYGLGLISTKDVKQCLDEDRTQLTAPIFAIDQSPSKPDNAYWMTFLNQDTGVSYGLEKYAMEYNYPVVFGRINKLKRGYYSIEFDLITENPSVCVYGEILEKANRMLEIDILAKPEFWLWTHRRWKHKRPEGK